MGYKIEQIRRFPYLYKIEIYDGCNLDNLAWRFTLWGAKRVAIRLCRKPKLIEETY